LALCVKVLAHAGEDAQSLAGAFLSNLETFSTSSAILSPRPSKEQTQPSHGKSSSASCGLHDQVARQAPLKELPRLSPCATDSSSSALQNSGIRAHHKRQGKRHSWRVARIAKFRAKRSPLFAWWRIFRLFCGDASPDHRLVCDARLPHLCSELPPRSRKPVRRA